MPDVARGGPREGAGKPKTLPEDTRPWSKRLTEAEIVAVEALVKKMRSKKKPSEESKG